MKTQREKFEEWAKKEGLPTLFLQACGFYDAKATEIAWRAWQAAIDSIVVELPEPHEDEWHELNFTVDETKEAIEKAGVKHE